MLLVGVGEPVELFEPALLQVLEGRVDVDADPYRAEGLAIGGVGDAERVGFRGLGVLVRRDTLDGDRVDVVGEELLAIDGEEVDSSIFLDSGHDYSLVSGTATINYSIYRQKSQ